MALWNADDGGFSGGGYFTGKRAVTLHHSPNVREAIIAPPRDLRVTSEWPARTSALLRGLESTGWKLRQEAGCVLNYVTGVYDQPYVFEKAAGQGERLRLEIPDRLQRVYSLGREPLHGATWADVDRRGRVVMAQRGVLQFRSAGGSWAVLQDLNVDEP